MRKSNKNSEFFASPAHVQIPGIFKERITRSQLQQVLLRGDIIVKGHVMPWKYKHIGAGVYELWVNDPFKSK